MSEREKTNEAAGASAPKAAPAASAPDGAAGEGAPAAGEEGAEGVAPATEEAAAKLAEDLAAEKDRNIRLLADFDNFRRRVAREKNETYQRAAAATIAEFLPVIDNFERAIAQAPGAGDPFADGVRMVYGQFSDILAKAGVTPIVSVGAPFNPAEHEAIAYQPSADAPEGQVVYEAKRGYRMGDHVIRPASVIVSSGAPQPAEPATAAPAAEASAQEEREGEV